MHTLEYRDVVTKADWPRGEWDGEPDKRQWQDPATGLPCIIRRNPIMGNLCGYVGVPEGHPLFGQGYDDCPVRVHGGLTFASACDEGPEDSAICHVVEPGESDKVWWFGFDCGHAFDLMPGMLRHWRGKEVVYRDWAYVEAEVAELARQLHDLSRLLSRISLATAKR